MVALVLLSGKNFKFLGSWPMDYIARLFSRALQLTLYINFTLASQKLLLLFYDLRLFPVATDWTKLGNNKYVFCLGQFIVSEARPKAERASFMILSVKKLRQDQISCRVLRHCATVSRSGVEKQERDG